MPQTHLLLVDVPRMLRDIVVRLIGETSDLDIVGDVQSAAATQALHTTNATFVISGRDDKTLVDRLLDERPAVVVLTVTEDGHHGILHRLVPERVQLGELWPERLLEIIRAAAGSGRAARER